MTDDNFLAEQATQLLSLLWDESADGQLDDVHCIAHRKPEGRMEHALVPKISDAVRLAEQYSFEGQDVYFALASYKRGWHENPVTGKYQFRKQENALKAKCIWLDIDCGGDKAAEGKGYATQREATIALNAFCKRYMIPPPTLIIDSGNGIHVYWVFNEWIDKKTWNRIANRIKTKTEKFGLLVDKSRTTDIASILRLPGTFNYKDRNDPKPVTIVFSGVNCTFEILDAALGHEDTSSSKPIQRVESKILDALLNGLEETQENVDLVKSMLDTLPADCDRETWLKVVFAIASLNWSCDENIARKWSMTSDKYDEVSFDTLWQSFDPNRPGGITIGTLYHMAGEAGWVDPQAAQLITNPEQYITGSGGDITNGKLFAHMYNDKLVYIPELGAWLMFTKEAGWVKTPYGEVERAAKAIVQTLRERASELYKTDPEGSKTKQLMKHVEASSKMPKLRDMIDAAKSELGMSRSLNEFDADPMLLGLANGVFDLRTGQLLPITPDILVTKRCKAAYDRNAKCLRLDQFMVEIQPDPVIRDFLQRLAGYLLTGQVSEQIFVFMYGLGANGKSVFIELLAWLMGDYGRKIATEMLMHHQRSPQGPSPDIVALKGIRLAYANETEEGRRLAEARVKDMTGGDTLTGRVPYAKVDITFLPTHKLLMVGNHKPEIIDSSYGMWRRVVLIDFGVTIPEAQQDKHLLDKLKSEGPGILNWMLEGARQWQQGGLQVPQKVQAVTQAYRDEQDVIGEWIADHCKTGAGCTEDKKLLYRAYRGWMVSNGHHPLAQGRLTRRLNERGYTLQPDKRTVAGLKLESSIRMACV